MVCAVSVGGGTPHDTATKLCATFEAGAYVELPAWDAVMTTVPIVPVSVTVLPETVAGPLTTSVTGKPEVATGATMVKGASHAVWLLIGANVIVCGHVVTTKVRDTAGALE